MSHVFLVGFMGCGKSTVGRLLAQDMSVPFVDLDVLVQERADRPLVDIFAHDGEDAFRDLESAALSSMASAPRSVVACGGGVVLRDANRALLRELGTVILLSVTAGEAMARVGDTSTRPLLADRSISMATTLLAARESLYRAVADITVDTDGRTPEQVAEEARRGLLPLEPA
ncbi:MAG: shikimate kinase [Actinomycetota bacterium]|nr:shikimate kinase [Actinomycetota bacterium]